MIGKMHVSRAFEAIKCGKGSTILDQSHLIWLVIVDYNYIYIYIYICPRSPIFAKDLPSKILKQPRQRSPQEDWKEVLVSLDSEAESRNDHPVVLICSDGIGTRAQRIYTFW